MKRAIILFLTAALLLPLAACSGKTPDKQDTADPSSETSAPMPKTASAADEALAHLGERDFDGANFHILCLSGSFEFDQEETTGELMNDEVYARNRTLEARYGVEITAEDLIENHAGRPLSDRVRLDSLASNPSYQVVSSATVYLIDLAKDGLCFHLPDMPWIDLDQPYWDQNSIDAFTIADSLYFVMGSVTLLNMSQTLALFVNRDLAEDLSIPDLYEMVWNGTWTIDRMTEYCERAMSDRDGTGKMEFDGDDTWGAVFAHPQYAEVMMTGLGYHYTRRDENGNFVLDLMNENNLVLFDHVSKLRDTCVLACNWVNYGPHALDADGKYIFYEGRALFLHHMVSVDMTTTACNYGILPQPKFNEEQEKYLTSSFHAGSTCVAVPMVLSESDRDMGGFMLEAMAALSYVTTYPTYIEKILELKKSPDPDSTRVLKIMFENIAYDIVYQFNIQDFPIQLAKGMFHDYFTTYASNVKRFSSGMEDDIYDIMDAYYEHAHS